MAEYNDYIMLKPSSPSKSASPAKKKAAAKKAPTKTVVTPGTKVSSATINKIKSMGMTAALKGANSASPEMREGIRRLYGATRYNKAVVSKAAPKPTDSRFSGMAAAKPKARTGGYTPGSAKSGKATYTTGSGVRNTAKKVAAPAKKKTGTTDPFAKFVMATGRALKEPFTSKPVKKTK